MLAVILNGWPILITQSSGIDYAVLDRCTHAESALHGGRVRRGTIMCPLHGARFDLATGKCTGSPHAALRIFAIKRCDNQIMVEIPNAPT